MAFSAMAVDEQELPRIEGENFVGRKVVLPEAVAGKVAVLVLGFSKGSKTQTSAWGKRIHAEFQNQPAVELYQLPVLEDVPRFVRGVVISGIKSGVPENMRDHVVPVLRGEKELKKLVSYRDPDDAYLLVLDRSGKVACQVHGGPSATSYRQLHEHIEALLK
jgi:hypothetical protein